jgi:hypothetical protein
MSSSTHIFTTVDLPKTATPTGLLFALAEARPMFRVVASFAVRLGGAVATAMSAKNMAMARMVAVLSLGALCAGTVSAQVAVFDVRNNQQLATLNSRTQAVLNQANQIRDQATQSRVELQTLNNSLRIVNNAAVPVRHNELADTDELLNFDPVTRNQYGVAAGLARFPATRTACSDGQRGNGLGGGLAGRELLEICESVKRLKAAALVQSNAYLEQMREHNTALQQVADRAPNTVGEVSSFNYAVNLIQTRQQNDAASYQMFINMHQQQLAILEARRSEAEKRIYSGSRNGNSFDQGAIGGALTVALGLRR